MEQLMVKTNTKEYPIAFCKDFNGLADLVKSRGLEGKTLCIVTDSSVAPLYLEQVKAAFLNLFENILSFVFEAGEKQKTLDTISQMYRFFIENKLDRKAVIAALGGGVCGDMAGFAAATYLRGIAYIQIPTTLLSQVDSSVGGKTGVDFLGSKNMIGAFYQPELVYINSQTLKTLPQREFSAGMAEVMKYGYILSQNFLEDLKRNKELILSRDSDTLLDMIAKCCGFKAEVVSQDERELGIREILNFGHTIGHSIETLLFFRLLHGECVGLGIIAALSICVVKGKLSGETLEEAKELLHCFGLPLTTNNRLDADEIYGQLSLDKKVKNNKISFVLLNAVGQAFSTTEVSRDEYNQAILAVL